MLQLEASKLQEAAGWPLPSEFASPELERTLSDPDFPGALIPAREGSSIVWYAASSTQQEWRLLRRLLLAYAGPTVTSFDGRTLLPRPTVQIEHLLLTGACALARLSAPNEQLEFASRALERLVKTHEKRPKGGGVIARSTQALLARLDLCLATGDRDEALSILQVLRSEWRLDALNLKFVEVKIFAHFRDWSAIANDERLSDLVYVRKPPAVAAAILEALYWSRLAPHQDDKAILLETYKREVRALAGPLLAQTPESLAVVDLYRELEPLIAQERHEDPVESAQRQILHAAETESIKATKAAFDQLSTLSVEKQQEALEPAPVRAALDALTSVKEKSPPTEWIGWLEALKDPTFTRAREWAERAATELSVADWSDPVQAAKLADSILAIPSGLALERLALSLPTLVRWVRADPEFPRTALRRVYDALLTQLIMMEGHGQPEREASSELFEAMLSIGSPKDVYVRLLDDMGSMLASESGQATAYWSFDLADIVMRYAAPSSDARAQLLSRILTALQSCLPILTLPQRLAYDRVASTSGWPPLQQTTPTPEANSLESALRGKTLAIYTLTESAARQAELVIRRLSPTVKVELAHDHVASPRLERLAKTADIFVLVANSAKHAATDCIVRSRSGRPLTYAAGKGFCSIVRAVESALAH
ncbi:MAG TPA: hypothetical protein VFB54_17410 [Burkholderiales bacterium]|nr:hypothetical protein [Burkholderiales bacterium]